MADETQFCLRWNNFQANITSQFETLRDDEDFTDVTIACEGQRLQAHKVVLSACSPFFKELFKTNPCSHPIIFMRDVKAHDVVALMEFMYAGEVNVAQAHLPTFLKTAESLKIRGLTETSNRNDGQVEEEQNSKQLESSSPSSTVTSTQQDNISNLPEITIKKSSNFLKYDLQTKVELPDCLSDEDHNFFPSATEAMEVVQAPAVVPAVPEGASSAPDRRSLSQEWSHAAAYLDQEEHFNNERDRNKMVKLGEGIEVFQHQLVSLKLSDYRKLTRGLAGILFSPMELATCSVTGQRWSRAGFGTRPVKPALDRYKVQALISYVTSQFPSVEVTRIKQVLAYKCKEHSAAFRMRSDR